MNPSSVEHAIDAALEHHRGGRFDQAEAIYRQALAQYPNHADALNLLGALSLQTGRAELAVDLIARAVQINPSAVAYYLNWGRAFASAGRLEDAIDVYRRGLALDPLCADLHNNLGIVLRGSGQLPQAIEAFRRAVSQNPRLANAYNNLAVALETAGDAEGALAVLHHAVEHCPSPEIYYNLGNTLRVAGKADEAVEAYQHAIQLRPRFSKALFNLAKLYQHTNRSQEAIGLFREAIATEPNWLAPQQDLAQALITTGQLDETVQVYRRALTIAPDHPFFHHNLGSLLLLKGDYINGWPEMEWRWKLQEPGLPRPAEFARQMWDGGELHGQRILLHAEQGFGDTIQFTRYVPLVAGCGGAVTVTCPKVLTRLLRPNLAGPNITVTDDPVEIGDFDVQCPLLSLPLVFQTTLQTIPAATPYLRADSALAKRWQARMNDPTKLRVGLVWAGRPTHLNDQYRSIRLETLAPLTAVSGVSFISLQKGNPAEQVQSSSLWRTLIDWTSEIEDFADTAALIECLDLVIGVDTAVAHLAGAMGKPVWLLLPYLPDWRWMLGRTDSPWYPTMRLFRQPKPYDWESVVIQVICALQDFRHSGQPE